VEPASDCSNIFSANREVRPELILECVAWSCFLFAAYIAIRYAAQAPYDLHAFRQTQTALTSYWFLQDGLRFDYETPVAGYPWSIPFEFPIFQVLVALIAKLSGCRLEVAGRLLSFAFLTACLIPARQIVRKLALPRAVFFAFVALLFSSPVYLYWGRTFMIETAALFFAVAAIPFWLDVLRKPALRPALWFALFSTLAMLQKVTTEIPLLGILGLCWLWHRVRSSGGAATLLRKETLLTGALCFVVPVAMGAAWVIYSDHVKAENPLGAQLTSQALAAWNWGHLAQRFSGDLLVGALWRRLFEANLGGYLGAFGLCVGVLRLPVSSSSRTVVALCVAVGLVPLFTFSNLYIVHKYYLTANAIALLFGLAVVAGIAFRTRAALAGLVGVVLVVASNLSAFIQDYLPSTRIEFDIYNSRDMAVGEVLRKETAPTQAFVAFGNDWSSSLAYASGRKSFTVAPFFERYAEVQQHPERFVGDAPLGAVVVCLPAANSLITPVLQWAATNDWTTGDVAGCFVVVPAHFSEAPVTSSTACKNTSIESADTLTDAESGKPVGGMLNISGWTIASNSAEKNDDAIYIALTNAAGQTVTRRALSVPRPDIAARLHRSAKDVQGFSLIVDASKLSGNYKANIVRQKGSAVVRCLEETPIDLSVSSTHHP
jgi:hypothetical protein